MLVIKSCVEGIFIGVPITKSCADDIFIEESTLMNKIFIIIATVEAA